MRIEPTWKNRPVRSAVQVVADARGVTRKFLRSDRNSRQPEATKWRFLVWWLARQRGASYPHIGHYTGGFDHTTVVNGVKQAEAMRASDQEFRALSDRLLAALMGGAQ